MCLWITLWITCGYVDNFLLVYVFILCVYGFLWGESDKFYMFECVVDNFVDNLWITTDTKTYQKNKLFDIQQIKHKRKTERERENPGENAPGLSLYCRCFRGCRGCSGYIDRIIKRITRLPINAIKTAIVCNIHARRSALS